MWIAFVLGLAITSPLACSGETYVFRRDAGQDGAGLGSGGVSGGTDAGSSDTRPGFVTIYLDGGATDGHMGEVAIPAVDAVADAGPGVVDARLTFDVACDFASLWRSVVDAAAVIGYCDPVVLCSWDVAAGTPVLIANLYSCTAWGADDVGVTLVEGGAYSGDGGGRYLNDFVVFDADGRLVEVTMAYSPAEQPLLDSWAGCRWPYFAGKVIGASCYSE